MKYLVSCYHGKNERLETKIESFCAKHPEQETNFRDFWEFEGSLNDFLDKWQDKFLFYPGAHPFEGFEGVIYVTNKGSFGTY